MTALVPAQAEPCPIEAEGIDLTPMQRSFVHAFVENGGIGGAAARAAGYAASGADAYASRLLRNPLIKRAIFVVSAAQLGLCVPGAVATVKRLSLRAKSEYVQLEASKDILDRVGLAAPKRVDVSGGVSVTIDLS